MGNLLVKPDEFTRLGAMTYLIEKRLSKVVREIGWKAHLDKRRITQEEYHRMSQMVEELGIVMHYLEEELTLMGKGETDENNSS